MSEKGLGLPIYEIKPRINEETIKTIVRDAAVVSCVSNIFEFPAHQGGDGTSRSLEEESRVMRLEMLVGMQIEILNGVEILVNWSKSRNSNLPVSRCTNLN